MALDISSVYASPPHPLEGLHAPAHGAPKPAAPAAAIPTDLQSAITDLEKVSMAFNRRLAFSVNEKLGQVVVKVVDSETDKVVREIPPAELQHVYERIREVMGLLFDEEA